MIKTSTSVEHSQQLLDAFFFFCRIIKIEVRFVNRGQRLTTLTESLMIPDFTKAESNQNCTEENNDKHSAPGNIV